MQKNKTVPGAEKAKIRSADLEQAADERKQESIRRGEAALKMYEQLKTELDYAQATTHLSKKDQKKEKQRLKEASAAAFVDSVHVSSSVDLEFKETCESRHGYLSESATLRRLIEALDVQAELTHDSSTRVTTKHATHIPGLPGIIAKLAKKLIGCTITTGKSSTTSEMVEILEMRVQREVGINKYRCIARDGSHVQELCIVDKNGYYDQAFLQDEINTILYERANKSEKRKPDFLVEYSSLNRAVAYQTSVVTRKEKEKEEDDRVKERKKQVDKEKILRRRERILHGKTQGALIVATAVRDESILDGTVRGKCSMR